MNYVILDLEWNQCPDGKENENKVIPFEIIEIGAIKLDSNGIILDEFSEIIKPVIYKEIHFKTKEVIYLQMNDLEKGKDFKTVCEKFLKWCGNDYYFCTWGSMDLTELQRNMKYYNIKNSFPYPLFYYDLQKVFSISLGDSKVRRTLEYAVDFYQIKKDNCFHRALSDARYTAMIFNKLNCSLIKKYYSVDYYINPKSKKEEINIIYDQYSKFISQEFETKEKAMGDKDINNIICYRCGNIVKKKIKWFTSNAKTYYSLGVCPNHGYIKAKIRIKKADNEKYFIVKISKLIDEDQSHEIYKKRQEILRRRQEKRQLKKLENII